MERRTIFPGVALPLLLVLPQFALTLVFFYLPAGQAIWTSFTRADPFGLRSQFVGLDNFVDLFTDPLYVDSIGRTAIFCAAVVGGLDGPGAAARPGRRPRDIRGRGIYRILLIWPYAVAPAIAAVLWVLLLHPQIGLLGRRLNLWGIHWDYKLDGFQAMLAVIAASSPGSRSATTSSFSSPACSPSPGR